MNQERLWKYNTADANGHVAEDGMGDGGLLIFASSRHEALTKIYNRYKSGAEVYLPDCYYDDEDDSEIPIHWSKFTQDEFIAELTKLLDDPDTLFLVPFPSNQIIL